MYNCSAIRKETLLFATIWMNLKDIILSEISQTEKDKYCMTSLRHGILKSPTQRNRVDWCKLPDTRWINSGDQMYSMVTLANCIAHLKFAKREDLECSYHTHTHTHTHRVTMCGNRCVN